MRRPSAATVSSLVAVGGSVAFVLWQLHPSLLLLNTTTTGGDLGAHVDLPAYLRSHLLPEGRLTGWSPDWYDGYPALTFYFPLPSLLIALVSYAIPFDVAFKLVTALGLVTLPVAAWAFGRLAGARRPVPELLAVATLPYMFSTSYTIYGGNIASTMAGEYAFSISLSAGLVFLGLVWRGLRTGRHRALAAALLGFTALCHMIPTLFVGLGALLLVLAPAPDSRLRDRLRWALPVAAVGGAVTGFWSIPFVLRQQYTTDMGWQKITAYASTLFPPSQHWVLALAAFGLLLSVLMRRRVGIFLGVMAALSALGFVLDPQGKLYNARVLPFWVLCLYLLAGLAAAEAASLLALLIRRLLTGQSDRSVLELRASRGAEGHVPAAAQAARAAPAAIAAPVLAFLATAAAVVLPLVQLPGWFPVSVPQSIVPSWVHWDYEGYQRKASYPEYRSLIATMSRVGRRYGCGRAMWEYEPEEVRLGTTMALMLLPYWTGGCIDSEEGLLFESSATTPYHFIDQSEMSADPSRAMLGLPYGPLDVPAGVAHLQLLGVRYYMAISPEAQQQASQDPALRLVATSGPWLITYGSQVERRTWQVYEVAGSAQVSPLSDDPAVLTGLEKGAQPWLDAALPWYGDPSRFAVPLAASGPPDWPRVSVKDEARPPQRRVAPARVSRIATTDDSISFDVSRTGSPVLVKTSYFPNWEASGASGPWRVTPNLMVVVPTARHVTLHYGYTSVDLIGWLVTLAGLAGLAWLALGARIVRRSRRTGREGPKEPPEAPAEGAQGPELVGARRDGGASYPQVRPK